VRGCTLQHLALGSCDLVLDGRVVASLVRSGQTSDATWTAELLEDMPQGQRPAPFSAQEHTFSSLKQAQAWLGRQCLRHLAASSRGPCSADEPRPTSHQSEPCASREHRAAGDHPLSG
jgi:hypothetical protein